MTPRVSWIAHTLLYGLSGVWLVGCGGGSGESGAANNPVGNPPTTTSTLLKTNITTCATADQNDLLCTPQALADVFGLKQDAEIQSGTNPNYQIVRRNNDACVEDRVTGLTWELKTRDTASIHYVDHAVYWYEPDFRKNGGNAGLEHDFAAGFAPGEVCGFHIEYCNTHAFIQKLNQQQYCGYSDWRLPKPTELSNLVDYGATTPPFVYQPVVVSVDAFYWTGIPVDIDGRNPAAKAVSFFTGATSATETLYAAYAIAVRGQQFAVANP